VQLNPPTPGGWAPGTYELTQRVTAPGRPAAVATTTFRVLADADHDGTNLRVRFDPQTLYVPSNGNSVTLTLRAEGDELRTAPVSSVRIVRIANTAVSIPVDASGGTGGWVANGDGTWSAKFSRIAVTCAMHATGLVGGYLPVVVTAGTGASAVRGFDPRYPVTTPETSPATC
jgi:hypothetical protein